MKIKEKASNFMEEHGGELIVCGGMILAYGVGLIVGTKITTLQFNAGMANLCKEKPEIEGLMLDAIKTITEKKKQI